MIEPSFLSYIKEFILKSGEELEGNFSSDENLLSEIKIIKRSVRTFRVVGVLTFSTQIYHSEVKRLDSKLEVLALTARKKVYLDDRERQTFKWLEEGWIIKEVRLEKDEKTVHSSHYRMGYRLYRHEQKKIEQKLEQFRNLKQIDNKLKMAGVAIAGGFLLLLGSWGLSWVLSYQKGLSSATSILSLAPGGLDQMGIIATAIHADLSVVSGYQLFRLFFIFFIVPPILRVFIQFLHKKEKMGSVKG